LKNVVDTVYQNSYGKPTFNLNEATGCHWLSGVIMQRNKKDEVIYDNDPQYVWVARHGNHT
jgi:hypothetical protein